ncbi:MAG: aldehyde dehydrogenase family protein [Bryobacterales bacterium]|nr:aldehyde dehydrogenase family protein [Bryobacterales bacterium]
MRATLLLVDLQRDYLTVPGLEPPCSTLVARAVELLETCRRLQVPVIHVWTTIDRNRDRRLPHWRQADRWLCVTGTAGHRPPERLLPRDDEPVAHKAGFNPFASGMLDRALRDAHCDTAILAGLHLHACVRAAATECLERGYAVWVASDAVASNDPLHAESTLRWLSARCVRFLPVSSVIAELGGGPRPARLHRSPRRLSDVLFEAPAVGAVEVAAAAADARQGWTTWRKTAPAVRWNLLSAVADALDRAAPDLATRMAIDIGKPISHALEEIHRAAGNVRDVVRRAAGLPESETEPGGIVRHRPWGVVAMISPWNNPVAIPIGKIAPALAYGNTVVWKPAPAAHGISLAVLELLRSAGVPSSAVRMVPGGAATARLLASDENVAAVTFTGSRLGGYSVQEICARRAVPLQAELSGNNAAIVWDDADFQQAAAQVAGGAFGFSGQRCTANRRVIVHTPRFEAFLSGLMAAGERLVWGDPLDPATDLGPVIDAARRDETAALLAAATADGAAHRIERLQQARAAEPWVREGAYAQPAIACCDVGAHPLVQEETMSPLLVVQRADDFDHALALCNGVRHGLAAALFTKSETLRQRFLDEAEAGILRFDASTAGADVTLPFGGWKHSGVGPPEHGQADRLYYSHLQTIYPPASGIS